MANSLLIPVFCCMAFAVESSYTARNIEHPVAIPRDVSFTPESGDFYARWYWCMLDIAHNPTKITRIAYIAQNMDATSGIELTSG